MNFRASSLGLGVALGLVACCQKPPAPAPPPTGSVPSAPGPSPSSTAVNPPPSSTAANPAPTTSASSHAEPWLGSWSSPGCDARRYERRLVFTGGGRVSGEERVSPCPAGVACVWSGVVPWQGSSSAEGARIVVLVDVDAPRHPGASMPSEFAWDAAAGVLVETADGARCPYVRAAAER